MRIVYTHDIFSRQAYGGISRYFTELIRSLVALNAELRLHAGLHINQHLRDLNLSPQVQGKFVPRARALRQLLPLANAVALGLRKADRASVIHHTYYELRPETQGIPLVVTAHDLIPEMFWDRRRLRTRGLIAAKRRCFEKATRVIAVSENTKQDLVRLYDLDPDKIDVIWLGNPLAHHVANPMDDPSASPRSGPYLLYVGVRGGYKNWDALVRALAMSQRLRQDFHLICFGGGGLTKTERELLGRLDLERHVTQVAGDDPTLAHYYRHARAFVFPSRYEGFGLPSVEAMGLGCPVVCARIGAVREVVGDAGAYFDPDDVESIRHAIETAVYDERRLADLRERGWRREAEFRWDQCARRTLATYAKAAA